MASVDRLQGLSGDLAIKAPVRVATTAAITLSGLQTIDGVTLVADDRVLVKDQADTTANGIYAASTSSWTRTLDCNGDNDLVNGTFVIANSGTTNAGVMFKCGGTDPITVGTDAITFTAQFTIDTLSSVSALLASLLASGAQPIDASLTAYAALTTAANKGLYFTGADAPATFDITAFGRTMAGYADAATAFDAIKQAATDAATGVVELATSAEVQTGTDATRVVTPATLRATAIVSETTKSATGASVDFTGIPAWVKRITVLFSDVSLSGTDDLLVRIGDSGGLETSGYVSTGMSIDNVGGTSGASSTSGFIVDMTSAASILGGRMVIELMGSNIWIASHSAATSTTTGCVGGGSKTLTGTLDRLSILPAGANTFDGAGSINILYE